MTDQCRYVDKALARTVCDNPDSLLRGHQVALAYYDLSERLQRAIDPAPPDDEPRTAPTTNANWFTFATWATTTVNRNIGNRSAPVALGELLPGRLSRAFTPAVLNVRAAADQEVSRALSTGQILVFASVVGPALRLLEHLEAGRKKAKEVADTTWEPQVTVPERLTDGITDQQRNGIARGFVAYRDAALATDSKERAELILYGNLLIGTVEQQVLHAAVNRTIESVPARATRAAETRIANLRERASGRYRELTMLTISGQLAPLANLGGDLWAAAMTRWVLALTLPGETLSLGRAVPPRRHGAALYPEQLRSLSRPELRQLWRAVDRSYTEGSGSGAVDWRRYPERVRWMAVLFRSRQQERTLRWRPYSEEDMDLIKQNRLPIVGSDPYYDVIDPPSYDAARDLLAGARRAR